MDPEKITKLQALLDEGQDWEKLDLGIGAYIVKMPKKGRFPAKLALELNPLKNGKPMKRKGLFITDADSFTAFMELFQNEKLLDVIQTLDDLNVVAPSSPESAPIKKLDI